MKVKISVPQIIAQKITHPRTDDDEIYCAYFVSLAKSGAETNKPEVKKYVSKCISDVKDKVWAKTKWAPSGLESIIEVDDSDVFYLTMALYERDDGVIYKKLKKESEEALKPEDFDWSCVTLPEDVTSVLSWVKAVWKLVCGAFNYLRQDDLLGEESIAVMDIDGREWTGFRELKFKKWGGDYRVTLNMEVLDE